MRKRLGTIVAVCMLALFAAIACAGCSSDSQDYTPETKQASVFTPTIGEEGVLRVGVNSDTSPLAGMSNGEFAGIDVDIAAYLADELGLKLSVVDVGNDPQGAISAGTVDIVMGIDDESDAFESLWTSEEYLPKGVALFAMESSNAGVPTQDADIRIAAQISSTSAWAVSNTFNENVLVSTTNLQEAFNYLAAGDVDYVAADAVIGLYAARVQNVDVSIVALMSTSSGYHVGVSSENEELQTAIYDALSKLLQGGIVNIVESKWLSRPLDFDGIEVITFAVEGSEEDQGQQESENNEVDQNSDVLVVLDDIANNQDLIEQYTETETTETPAETDTTESYTETRVEEDYDDTDHDYDARDYDDEDYEDYDYDEDYGHDEDEDEE